MGLHSAVVDGHESMIGVVEREGEGKEMREGRERERERERERQTDRQTDRGEKKKGFYRFFSVSHKTRERGGGRREGRRELTEADSACITTPLVPFVFSSEYRDISRHEPQGSVQVHRLLVTETTATDSVSVVASVLRSWRVLTSRLTHDNHAIRTALALRPILTGYAYAIPSKLKLTVNTVINLIMVSGGLYFFSQDFSAGTKIPSP